MLFNGNIVRMALTFGFGFQIMQCKLNESLSPDRHKNHGVLRGESPSPHRALHMGMVILIWSTLVTSLSFLGVRTWAWFKEMVKSSYKYIQTTGLHGLVAFE